MSRVRIGCVVDHEPRHYSFIRNSGLPYGTFHERDWWVIGSRLVLTISVAGFALALLMGWGGR